MTDAHSSRGWLVAVTRPNGDKTLYHAAITDPKEAAARVLEVAGEGTADAVGRLSHGQLEGLGMKDGDIRYAP